MTKSLAFVLLIVGLPVSSFAQNNPTATYKCGAPAMSSPLDAGPTFQY